MSLEVSGIVSADGHQEHRMRKISIVLFGLSLLACGGVADMVPGQKKKAATASNAQPNPPAFNAVSTNVVAVPEWSVSNLQVDDSCSSMMDYCVSVACDVASTAGKEQRGTVTFTVTQDGKDLKKHEALTLSGGQRQTITNTFKEASLFGAAPRGMCEVAYEGSLASCDIKNSGGVGAETVELQVILSDGSDMTTTEYVNLGPGDKKTIEHLFDVDPSRLLRVECDVRR
jgi:hypothetical protein